MSKKKNLIMLIEDFHEQLPACPNCSSPRSVVKAGVRTVRGETTQRYLCNQCSKRFTPRKIPRTSYPPRVILTSLTYYNQGHTMDQTIRTMRRRFKTKIPNSTMNNWIKRYGPELPFTRLRKRYEIDPQKIIKTRRLFHPQPYLFRVHTLKLNFIGKSFPQLKKYINRMLDDRMDYLFQSKKILRCSELANKIDLPKPKIKSIKNSPACRMTDLALELAKTKKERHERIEEFFLTNDSATVAVELPVYLTEKESGYNKPLAGHIDLVQVRSNKIHILDYKPDREGNVTNQLQLYARCLKKHTGIKDITCAYFDENGYFQFIPTTD